MLPNDNLKDFHFQAFVDQFQPKIGAEDFNQFWACLSLLWVMLDYVYLLLFGARLVDRIVYDTQIRQKTTLSSMPNVFKVCQS